MGSLSLGIPNDPDRLLLSKISLGLCDFALNTANWTRWPESIVFKFNFLEILSGFVFSNAVDLGFSYWKVKMHAIDREKTLFSNPTCVYEFQTIIFGFHGASATFQLAMCIVLGDVILTVLLVLCRLLPNEHLNVLKKSTDDEKFRGLL